MPKLLCDCKISYTITIKIEVFWSDITNLLAILKMDINKDFQWTLASQGRGCEYTS